jgi:hypothetical protein
VPTLPELAATVAADLAPPPPGSVAVLRPACQRRADGPALVTTGLDAGRCAGVSDRPASPAARSPRCASTSGRSPRPIPASPRVDRRAPKVLVATQTKVIVVDPQGDLIPSVPVIAVHPRRPEGGRWPPCCRTPVAAGGHPPSGRMRRSLKLSARQVLAAAAVTSVEGCDGTLGGDLDGAAVEMCRAYGLHRADAGPILDWWRARAGRMVASV